MHTLMVVTSGVGLLVLMLLAGWLVRDNPGARKGARIFLVVWLAITLVNLVIGVMQAGYSLAEEIPIALVVYFVPAALALLARRMLPARQTDANIGSR